MAVNVSRRFMQTESKYYMKSLINNFTLNAEWIQPRCSILCILLKRSLSHNFKFRLAYSMKHTLTTRISSSIYFPRISIFSSSSIHTNTCRTLHKQLEPDFPLEESEEGKFLDDEDEEYSKLIKRAYRVPGMGHSVLVIQPRVKWGPKKKLNTTADLQLAEAVTLAETLPGWKVVEKLVVPVLNPDKKVLFGTGNSERLRSIVHCNPTISAVFVSLNILNSFQSAYLEDLFGVPVFDRYTIVLQIFKDHAHTKEAKLQTALAEIPYLRSRLLELHETGKDREGGGTQYIGGGGETFLETRKRLLFVREMRIKKQLEILKKQRHLLRQNRVKKQLPTIAVVGYTNSGKTSLIKALTQDSSLEPKDQLFATLDVTVHAGLLPSFQKVLYVDTVGFISDIPTNLIHSFAATLEDVSLADLIVHIRDISHPDAEAQKDNVIQTLEGLNLPTKLLASIVEVCNKVDLLDSTSLANFKESLLISATCGTGLDVLRCEIERKVMENNGQLIKVFRVPSGRQEFMWLYKASAVKAIAADEEDSNFVFIEVVITPANLAKFTHKFGNLVCEAFKEEG